MLQLSKPYITEVTAAKVGKILSSGRLVQGPEVEQFENELAKYLDVTHVVVVSSGTAALHLSLIAHQIGPGDEVIVPAYSFPAVANAVELTGATPIFADIDADNLCIDPRKIANLISPATKAIMPVHEFGHAADMDSIIHIARHHNLIIIEDAACALGTSYKGMFAGTIGNTGCFSFHPRKILTTGEGGAIATNNSIIAQHLRQLRNHGMQLQENKFQFISAGFNYRMTDFQATIGRAQLTDFNETIEIHRKQAALYHQLLNSKPGISLDKPLPESKSTYQTFHVLLDTNIPRDSIKQLMSEHGIETNIGAYSIPETFFYSNKYQLKAQDYLVTKNAFNNGLALPIGRHLNTENIHFIANTLLKVIGNGL